METTTLTPYALRTQGRSHPREVDVRLPRFSWRLRSTAQDDDQSAYRLLVDFVSPVESETRTVWDSGWVSTPTVGASYDGDDLESFRSYRWQLSIRSTKGGEAAQVAEFETGALDSSDWEGAWIGRTTEHVRDLIPAGAAFERTWVMQMASPALRVRRTIDLHAAPVRARLFTSAHGVYRPFVNGERVGDEELAPGWTDYRRRVHVRGHDITRMLTAGANTLGMIVGDGWWCGCVGYDVRRHARQYGDRPHAFAQLVLDFADASREVLSTDARWEERPGEILYSDLLMGECHDLTQREPEWCTPGSRSTGWRPVVDYDRSTSTLVSQPDEAVGAAQRLPGRIVSRNGERILIDFEQNMVGHVALEINGVAPNSVIRIRHGELLHEGELFTENLRSAEAMDVVVAASSSVVFEPWFTFHGFRYAEITGVPAGATLAAEGVVVTSLIPDAGTLETSDPLINRLMANIRWGQRGNFLSVPTDCPQRDERLGWTADAQVFAPTAAYLSDVEAFFGRWLLDLSDNQLPNGSVPDVIPLPPPSDIFDFGAPGWGDAATIVPWTLYRFYGDRSILERQYDSMVAWVNYVSSRVTGGLWDAGRGNDYGDWLSVDEDTDRTLVATAYRARSLDLVVEAAKVLGRNEDAHRYAALSRRVRDDFTHAYADGDRLRDETQTGYLLALAWNLVPDELRSTFTARLVDLIRDRGTRLSTGFLGVGLLAPTLTRAGHADVALDLLFQTEYPSWGYSIRHGATTIWERWDGWTEHAGFQAATMNSFNHYSLGSVGEWMFSTVGGIAQSDDSIAFRELVLDPRFDARLDHVTASYETPRGLVAVAWNRVDNRIEVSVEVPPGASALAAFLPDAPRLPSGRYRFNIAASPVQPLVLEEPASSVAVATTDQ